MQVSMKNFYEIFVLAKIKESLHHYVALLCLAVYSEVYFDHVFVTHKKNLCRFVFLRFIW